MPADWRREMAAGSKLPYLAQIDDRTILLRDGRLMQVIAVEGLQFETADSDEINYRKTLRDAMLQAIGSSRFALYHHVVRRPVNPGLSGQFPDAFSNDLDERWHERLARKQLFVNELYLTLIRRPLQGRAGALAGLVRRASRVSSEAFRSELVRERRELDAAGEAVLSTLAPYRARMLNAYEHNGTLYSEPLEFLSQLYNGTDCPVVTPEGDIGLHLPFRRISFGSQTAEQSAAASLGRSFIGMVSIKDYPGSTAPGMLDELLRLPIELTISQSFAFTDRQEALSRMNLVLRRMRAADDEAASLRMELGEARDEVAAGRAAFGEHHLTVAVRASSQTAVDGGVAEVQAALTDLGLVAVREDIGLETAFWAQFPGNFQFIGRRALVSSRNFASFASLHSFPRGQSGDCHWGGPITLLETTASGSYSFSFHDGDLGNFTVIGPSGSGKTVVLNFLLAQARRFDPRIVFFDKDRGAEIFLRAIGGNYESLRVGEPAGFNPLQLDDTPENRKFLIDWTVQLAGQPGGALSPADLSRIGDAVEANMAAPRRFRKLSHYAQLLRGDERPHANDLFARLQPWFGSGEHAWLFDNDEDRIDLSARVAGFDMTRILDDPVTRTPAMMYLFHRVEERLDGTPAIIVVDEGWKVLDDPVFTHRVRDWEKTIRKRNGIVGFATQSAEDALRSQIASAIIEQSATNIFMANPKARRQDYVEGFGLSDYEYQLVKTLPDCAHAFLIKHGTESVVVRLDLSGDADLLTVLSGRESSVRLLDRLRADGASSPNEWLPRLVEVSR